MIKFNNTIINPKNIDFVQTYLGSQVKITYFSGKELFITTKSIKEATQLINDIYEDMTHELYKNK